METQMLLHGAMGLTGGATRVAQFINSIICPAAFCRNLQNSPNLPNFVPQKGSNFEHRKQDTGMTGFISEKTKAHKHKFYKALKLPVQY